MGKLLADFFLKLIITIIRIEGMKKNPVMPECDTVECGRFI
jgi:hypothetical protein